MIIIIFMLWFILSIIGYVIVNTYNYNSLNFLIGCFFILGLIIPFIFFLLTSCSFLNAVPFILTTF